MEKKYIIDWLETQTGKIPIVSAKLNKTDKWRGFKARIAINRSNYKVEPGIYAVGNPDSDSIVLVSANYKLSFDILRTKLNGLDAWILVLDTKGINVWCAAGKGTFGTEELVNRIQITGLNKIVNHRKVLAPQLGAVGIAAHEVKKHTKFKVIYGPIRASDIPAFLTAKMYATPEMRQVKFLFYDRLLIVPVEIVQGFKYLILFIALFFILNGLNKEGYSFNTAFSSSIPSTINLIFAFLGGTVIGPLLLPWLPGRSFSIKGFFAGLILFIILFFCKFTGDNIIEIIAWFLLITAISSFLTMNFTGASTYTSLSGVKKEMRFAVPLQITFAVTGFILWIISKFI